MGIIVSPLNFQISSPFDVVSSFDEAEQSCMEDGARLYQPYTTASLTAIFEMEEMILSSYHPWRTNSETFFAIGILTRYDTYPQLLYRDGEKVDPIFSDFGISTNLYGFVEFENDTCVGLKGDEFHLIPCFGYGSSKELLYSSMDLENSGQDCWSECNYQQGLCSWCGSEGYCCRKNYYGDGCDGSFGGDTAHVCVLKPGSFYFLICTCLPNMKCF